MGRYLRTVRLFVHDIVANRYWSPRRQRSISLSALALTLPDLTARQQRAYDGLVVPQGQSFPIRSIVWRRRAYLLARRLASSQAPIGSALELHRDNYQ